MQSHVPDKFSFIEITNNKSHDMNQFGKAAREFDYSLSFLATISFNCVRMIKFES